MLDGGNAAGLNCITQALLRCSPAFQRSIAFNFDNDLLPFHLRTMKSLVFALVAILAARETAAHATFQDLWINDVDQGQQCVRLPPSNSPITDVTSNDIRCNVNGAKGVTGRCAVKVGDKVTVEMHQQGGQRDCSQEAIGGAHYGPVHVYMSKVSDARTADGSSGWFKVYADTWTKASGSGSGDNDNWGTKDMNKCCGHVDFTIPSGIPSGDYLVRAEVIALHVAGSSGGAQFYASCCESACLRPTWLAIIR